MIHSLFNKSKPINLIITSILVIISFLASKFILNFTWSFNTLTMLVIAIFSLFIIDFISKKNQLSSQNGFILLFFSLFITLYWVNNSNPKIMYANFFILLALRKIISLESHTNTIQKIFDASLWISIASLFYLWSLSFFILLYVAIFIYVANNIKHWLVPLIGVFCVFIIVNSYHLFMYHSLFTYTHVSINFKAISLFSIKNKSVLIILGSLILNSLVLFSSSTQQISKKNKSSYFIIAITLIISISIFLLSGNISTLLFSFFPIAVLFSIVFEQFSKKWLQPIIIYLLIIVCIILYFM